MCFSLKSSLIALTLNWVSCAYLLIRKKAYWTAGFGFWLGLMQVADAGLWYAHEVDGERFEDCTRRNQLFTAIGVLDIQFQVTVQFIASWTYRSLSTWQRSLEGVVIAIFWLSLFSVCYGMNECRAETDVYWCSQLSAQRTIQYGYGMDKWGTNKCLRSGVFWGQRIADQPWFFIFVEMLLLSYPGMNCPKAAHSSAHTKRLLLVAPSSLFGFLAGFYFDSLSSMWCFFASFMPFVNVLALWLFPDPKDKVKADKVKVV